MTFCIDQYTKKLTKNENWYQKNFTYVCEYKWTWKLDMTCKNNYNQNVLFFSILFLFSSHIILSVSIFARFVLNFFETKTVANICVIKHDFIVQRCLYVIWGVKNKQRWQKWQLIVFWNCKKKQ